MDKLKFETPDMVAGNIEKIGALFPAAITEMRGEDGQIKRGINFEVLKQLLSRDVVDGDECYEFTWVGKKAAMAEAARPITKTLRPVEEDSRDWDTTQNIYIEGDNLEVLKILQESYLGKVKMIYIDPPYNTGHDFIYRDKFQRSQQEENDQMGMYDEDENQMFENTESNGRFHSDWCSMMYSRLALARNLLTEDGVIFISIDDNEVENLWAISNDIFGELNRIGTILWEGNGKNDSRFISESHEYVVVYAKSITELKNRGVYWRASKDGIKEIEDVASRYVLECNRDFTLATKKLREWFKQLDKSHPSWKHRHYSNIDERGVYFAGDISAESGRGREPYIVLHPITNKPCKMPARGFPTKKTMTEWIDAGYIDFGENENCVPKRKRYLCETDKYVVSSVIYKDSRAAFKNLVKMFGTEVFDNPKDDAVIRLLMEMASDKDSVILDFFSGSATTAHAVMQLNAEDGGHRKFIMVQLPEPCDEKSEAFKAGYKNICEIGKERIRRAGDKIKADNPLGTQDLDIGFRVFRVDSSNMKDVYYQPEDLEQQSIFNLVSNIKDDRTDLDLLYACLLDWGVEIHLPHTSSNLDGCTVHNVDNGALMACFSPNVPRSVVEYMAQQQPLRAVFRDSAFASDDAKINVTEIFKNLSPDTKVKVI